MSETLTNGVIVPDKGSRDWYADLRSNWLKLDSLMAGGNITINPAQTDGILVATITVGGREYKLYQQDGDVSVKIDPSTENAEYPLVASTSAEANTGSVVMAPAVTVNPSTGAVTATNFKGKLEGNASTATTATKAVQDGAGAVITNTYATKSELIPKANDADVVHKSGAETIVGTKTFRDEVQTNTIKAVGGGGANITLAPPDNGGFAVRAFNGTVNKELVGYPSGMLAWDNNEILTRVNGVTLDTAQTITGAKTFVPWTTFSNGINVKWITGNKEQKSLRLFATMDDSYQGYGASLELHSENFNGGFALRARNKDGTNVKYLTGDSNGALKWDNNEILTRVNGVTLDTAQTITGQKLFTDEVLIKSPSTRVPSSETWGRGITFQDSTGKRIGFISNYFKPNGSMSMRFFGSNTTYDTKELLALKWSTDDTISGFIGGRRIITEFNQIMLAKNLTGANITPGGVVDCGNGNGKLKQWYLGADGTCLLSDTLPTGIWKSTSFVTLAPNEGGIFIKLS